MKRILMTVMAALLFFAADALADAQTVPVKEIIALDESIKIDVGQEFELSYKVIPADADNKRVEFESVNPNIAAVDKYGTVLGKSVGSTRVKITSEDGNKYDYVWVRVSGTDDEYEYSSKLKNIAITKDTEVVNEPLEIMAGEKLTLAAKSYPQTESAKVRWRSDDRDIASVDENGVVTANKEGTCKITATSRVNTFKTDTVIVKVTKFVMYPEKLTITLPEDAVFETGSTIRLGCSFYPENTSQRGLYWTVTGGALIDQSGRLTLNDKGKITVRVYSEDRRVSGMYEFECRYSSVHFKEQGALFNLSKTVAVRLKFDNFVSMESAQNNLFANTAPDGNGVDIPIAVTVKDNIVTVSPKEQWSDECCIFIKPTLESVSGETVSEGIRVRLKTRN